MIVFQDGLFCVSDYQYPSQRGKLSFFDSKELLEGKKEPYYMFDIPKISYKPAKVDQQSIICWFEDQASFCLSMLEVKKKGKVVSDKKKIYLKETGVKFIAVANYLENN